ncbi:aldo/keto reductase [Thermoproteus tenax]|uniref:Dehydrogenase, aldo/keto reductase family n=1 Tax=Thermoproteus tenax (strain ATCC 35583 / DSM 2078 / JCM 9277 / NBRC 100435 / Kra 1) TaxID=768679 RepID=G4RPJ1_THETK|nr:aldo/keto reductase [Thermoproteus tenax]CCC81486.1 dehydrogenase, aldo/keto reductase family [Thermoproteus tenax Kra 1]
MKEVKCLRSVGCVSAIGMGTWGMGGGFWTPDHSQDRAWVEALKLGIELGMTLIDTAEMYGGGHSEELVGEAIKGHKREDVFIVTKVWPNHAKYEEALRSIQASVKRLGTYADLILLHWPSDSVPICETVRAFEEAIDRGLTRFWGLSNFDVRGIEEARQCAKRYDIAAIENRYSLKYRADEASVIPYAQREGLLYLAYTPIEKGALASDTLLIELGRKYGKTPIQIALNWYIKLEPVVPIPKAGSVAHVQENAGAMGWRLSEDDWRRISEHFK